jgi:hypothetical protein
MNHIFPHLRIVCWILPKKALKCFSRDADPDRSITAMCLELTAYKCCVSCATQCIKCTQNGRGCTQAYRCKGPFTVENQ